MLCSNERYSICRAVNLFLFVLIFNENAYFVVIFIVFIIFFVILYSFFDLEKRKSWMMIVLEAKNLALFGQSPFALFLFLSFHIIIKRLDLSKRDYWKFRQRNERLGKRWFQILNRRPGYHHRVVNFLFTVLEYFRLCILFLFINSAHNGSDDISPFLIKFFSAAGLYFWTKVLVSSWPLFHNWNYFGFSLNFGQKVT